MASQAERLKNREISGGESESGASALWERLTEHPQRWKSFLHEVRVEMRQVTWPTRHEVMVTTFVVIVAVESFGAFFFSGNSRCGYLVDQLFHRFDHGGEALGGDR